MSIKTNELAADKYQMISINYRGDFLTPLKQIVINYVGRLLKCYKSEVFKN